MTHESAKASSVARKASSTAFFARPVVARLLEPCAWIALTTRLVVVQAEAERVATLRLLALLLVLRLCVDTAANLVVAPRLEQAPYDQRRIRRGLSGAKLVFALIASIAAPLALHAIGGVHPGAQATIAAAGGFERLLLALSICLCSYSMSTPLLREHRSLPVARPNLGPAAGALLAVVALPFVAPTASASLLTIAISVASSNFLIGGWQRFAAAAERLKSPLFFLTDADVRTSPRSGAAESTLLALEATRRMPFLLLPVLAPVFAVTLHANDSPFAALAALVACAAPPLAFDAVKGGRRFFGAALACAALLVGAWAAGPDALRGATVLVQGALILVVYLPASRALRYGDATSIALAILLYALVRIWIDRVGALAGTPLAETVLLVFAAWSARGCGPGTARVG
jgi:hypothetical protein